MEDGSVHQENITEKGRQVVGEPGFLESRLSTLHLLKYL